MIHTKLFFFFSMNSIKLALPSETNRIWQTQIIPHIPTCAFKKLLTEHKVTPTVGV